MSDQTTAPAPEAVKAAPTNPALRPPKPMDLQDTLKQGLGELFKKAEAERTATPPPAAAPAEVKPAEAPKVADKPSIFDRRPKTEKKPDASVEAPKPADVVADPLEAIEPEAHTSEAQKSNFAKLREGYKSYKAKESEWSKREAEYKAQLEAAKKTPTTTPQADPEVERIKAEHKAMADRIALLDLQSHPDFVKQFVAPKQAALNAAQEVLAYNERKADLGALMDKPQKEFNAALADLTKGMNSVDAATVVQEARNAYKVHVASKEAISKSQEISGQLQQKSAYEAKQAFESHWGEISDNYRLLKQDIPAEATPEQRQQAEEYNRAADGIRQTAEQYAFGRLDPKSTASVATKAALLDFLVGHGIPKIESAISAKDAEIANLQQQIASLRASRSPGIPTGDTGVKQAAAPSRSRYAGSVTGMAEDIAEGLRSLGRR